MTQKNQAQTQVQYTLLMSLRSPFARRIRLLLEELQVSYSTEVVDVFNPPASIFEINPLGRVPALRLANGESISDSHEIQAYLRTEYAWHPIFARQGFSSARTLQWSALACGLMDYTVASFVESLRAPGLQDASVQAEALDRIHRTLRYFASELGGNYLAGAQIAVWDLDLGAALAYCDLRCGKGVVDRYPVLRTYVTRLHERTSFQKTIPPA